jgi:hypothetical protein
VTGASDRTRCWLVGSLVGVMSFAASKIQHAGPLASINCRRRRAVSFVGRANGSDVKLRGQGPRGYGRAARRLPAFELRDADGVTPRQYR